MIHILLIFMLLCTGCISVGEHRTYKEECAELNDPSYHPMPYNASESEDTFYYGHGEGDPNLNRNTTYIACNKTECTLRLEPWEVRTGDPTCYVMHAKRV